jgi:hypothetical protein
MMPSKFMRKVPFEAFAIVVFLVVVNIVTWAVCLGVLVSIGYMHLLVEDEAHTGGVFASLPKSAQAPVSCKLSTQSL